MNINSYIGNLSEHIEWLEAIKLKSIEDKSSYDYIAGMDACIQTLQNHLNSFLKEEELYL